MASRKIDDVLSAIADGVPIAWAEIEQSPEVPRPEFESLHLLQDIAHAFRATEPGTSVDRPAALFRWGTLEVELLLGTGSFGEVWRAFDPWLGRTVALKLQREDDGATARRGEQLDEARRLAQVRHSNVLSCYGCAVHDGRAGLWSELIEGRSLAQVLADDGALSIEETLRIGRDLARALAAVHATGLVHGDIKAGNVMREKGGRIVLMDFGAGGEERLLASRRLVSGTPAYLAPEVLDGAPLSRRSDVYALGVLLFLLLTAQLPYTEDSVEGLRTAQRENRLVNLALLRPDLDARARAMIERCIDVDPAKRPADVITLTTELMPTPHVGRTPDHASSRWRFRWQSAASIGAASIAVAIAWSQLSGPAWVVDADFVRNRGNTVETLADDAQVNVGDRLQLRLRSNRAAHVYVLNEDANGNATVLYPLDATSSDAPVRDEALLPGDAANPSLAWEVSDDSAREEFLVVAGLDPVRELDTLLVDWRRAARAYSGAATRSVGSVVENPGVPTFRGTRLNGVLTHIDTSGPGIRTWHFRFAHTR
jgi:hypothetical protein